MALPLVTMEGRTTADPELRFTPSGKAVANVTVVASERRKNDQTGEWEDGDRSPFIGVSVWGQAAEDLAETVTKGERVLVTGKLYARDYERQDGSKGQAIELKHATVAPIPGGKPKGERSSGNGYAHGQRPQGNGNPDPWATPPAQDPWAQPSGQSDEPPF